MFDVGLFELEFVKESMCGQGESRGKNEKEGNSNDRGIGSFSQLWGWGVIVEK